MTSDDSRPPSPRPGLEPPPSPLDEAASAVVDARRGETPVAEEDPRARTADRSTGPRVAETFDAPEASWSSGATGPDAPDPAARSTSPTPDRVSPPAEPHVPTTGTPPASAERPSPSDVAARASAMEAAATALRDIPPADLGARERALGAALAAFDAEATALPATGGRPTPPAHAPVTHLRAHRSRRPPGRWIGAAAAAVLLVGVLVAGLAGQPASDDSGDATVALDAPTSEAGDAGAAAEPTPESAPGADEDVSEERSEAFDAPADDARATVTLGEFATVDDLLDAAAGLPGSDEAGASAGAPATADRATGARCPDAAVAEGSLDPAPIAAGTVSGEVTEVWRVIGPGDDLRLVAFDGDCDLVGTLPSS